MNAKRFGCGVLSGWLLTATMAHAQTCSLGHAIQLMTTTVGQAASPGSRREAEELLRQARGAIKQGDLAQARWYLDRVEKMNVRFDGLFQRFGDSPQKVRRDLAKLEPTEGAEPNETSTDGLPESLPDDLDEQAAPLSDSSSKGQVVDNPFAVGGVEPPLPNRVAAPAQGAVQLSPGSNDVKGSGEARKSTSMQLLADAQMALNRGELVAAEQLAIQARSLEVPESAYSPGEMRPWMMLLEVERAKRRQAVAAEPAEFSAADTEVRQAVVSPLDLADDKAVQPASANEPLSPQLIVQGADSPFADDPFVDPQAIAPETQGDESGTVVDEQDATKNDGVVAGESAGYDLIRQGEQAVKAREFGRARELFAQAWEYEKQLDPAARQRLQDNLQLLRVTSSTQDEQPTTDLSPAEEAAVRRFAAEVSRDQLAINRQMRESPKLAWKSLEDLRAKVAEAEIAEQARRQLLARVDRSMDEAEKFIERNRARIELDDQNREVLAEIERRRQHRIDVDNQLAKLVDEFNTLMDQERFSEAVVLAKKARELAPNSPIVESMVWKSHFAERLLVEMSLQGRSVSGVEGALSSISESSVPFDDRLAIEYPNAKSWGDLTDRRLRALREGGRQVSEGEQEIQRALRKKVQVNFTQQPLGEVLSQLGNLAGVSIYLDPQGLAAEGATSDMPVTLRLNQEVQLKSALNIILEQYGLTFLVQDEVLKVTSESIRASKTYVETYNVADLVIPIPNFTPSYNMGLPSAIREAYNAQGFGAGYQGGYSQAPLTVLANNQQGTVGGQTFAQIAASEMMPTGSAPPQPLGFGPGGLGGGAQADFDTLIDLITATIAPDTWDDVGGDGSIQGFPTNLSLVVSQTQEVHEQIADLLEQLRRLQDLQVTIEVRFITLNDNFFERIGVDFDFDIDDNVTQLPEDDTGPSVTIGLDPQGNPTADLDISFTQGHFGDAVPAFGGFNAGSAANFGFAIISDIEAFFVIQAAQGDTRSNVLQAPKVTLFNGQQASVNDSSQRPFVTSVTPVVGDFAAAQAPIIVVLSEGTALNVQAVVSPDRRFVRLTLVPFFSKIGDVEEFTFEGRRTSNTGTTVVDPTDDTQTVANDAEEIIEGTTVQLPQFSFTSVSTTVSVPDGGTILLGGIKRLSEGRNERGVPLLSKFPYINRLFKNVGIGRTTQSLMMMVTPRIIIQEEEEGKLGISTTGS
jgi:general secretion pathway protein D